MSPAPSDSLSSTQARRGTVRRQDFEILEIRAHRAWRARATALAAAPFLAWLASAGVHSVVFVAMPSALQRAFATIPGSAADVAARLAVFWPHRPVAALPLRVPAPAAAGLPGVPAAALRGADPVLAGAFCPARRSWSVGQRAAVEVEPRSDVRPMRVADWLVAARCSVLLAGRRADPVGGSAAVPAWSRLAWSFPVSLGDQQADPEDGSAAVPV